MTVRRHLARSNIFMFLVPLLIAGLLLFGAGVALYILETTNLPRLGLSLEEMHITIEQYEAAFSSFETFLWIYLGAVGMALLLTIVFTNTYLIRSLFRHISQPLDVLVAGVERIQRGDLDSPIAYAEEDEFKAACDAVDLMAAKLKAALEDEQRRAQSRKELIAGMSHDLKSPLTSIRAYSEAIRDGVAVHGKPVALTNKEFELLLFLARHPNQVFSREDLYELIWGLESMGDNITVAVHVNRLRDKLEDDPSNPQLIQTVWGVGYRLNMV